MTTNPSIVSAWSEQTVETGDVPFDALIAQLQNVSIDPFWTQNSDGTSSFSISLTSIFNEEKLNSALEDFGARLDERHVSSSDDGTWSWTASGDDRIAHIEFTFGWGDCFVQCQGYRTLIAVVPSNGNAMVYDAGGDQLPDYLHLSPNTRPY